MRERPAPNLKKLRSDIKRLTSAPGQQRRLAEKIGVSPAQLNHWLTGLREPGGEVALTLRKWADGEMAKQKTADVLRARRPRVAQATTSKINEHNNSGRRPR